MKSTACYTAHMGRPQGPRSKKPLSAIHARIGQRLRQLRTAQKKTLAEVGAKVSMSATGVSLTERGLVNTPLDVLETLFAAVDGRFIPAAVQRGSDEELIAALQATLHLQTPRDRRLLEALVRESAEARVKATG